MSRDKDECVAAMSVLQGALSTGIYLSWSLNTPTGGTIMLTAATLFFTAWVLSPQHGVVAKWRASHTSNSTATVDANHPDNA